MFSLQDNRYEIEAVLGEGGFGITYRGFDNIRKRKVCIKEFFMRTFCSMSDDDHRISTISDGAKEMVDTFRAKFLKEAQTIASLDHPHIVKIHDVFEENGTAYYVMDYLEDGSLKEYVHSKGRLDPQEAMIFFRQIADALAYLHDRKIMHLDVKPANIMLGSKDSKDAYLIDFGISKHYDERNQQTSVTPVGVSKGYAPMEQYNDGGIAQFSVATDVYSLGATLYYMLTGENPPEAFVVVEEGGITPPAYIPERIRAAIGRAMRPRKADRYQTVGEFIADLEQAPKPEPRSGLGSSRPKDATMLFREPVNVAPQPVPAPNIPGRDLAQEAITKKWVYWMFMPQLFSQWKRTDVIKSKLALWYHPIALFVYSWLMELLFKDTPGNEEIWQFFFGCSLALFIGWLLVCLTVGTYAETGGISALKNRWGLKKSIFGWLTALNILTFGSVVGAYSALSFAEAVVVGALVKYAKIAELTERKTRSMTVVTGIIAMIPAIMMVLFMLFGFFIVVLGGDS